MTTNFFHLSLLLLFFGSGFGIRDPGWVKIKIRDKHLGFATLPPGRLSNLTVLERLSYLTAQLPYKTYWKPRGRCNVQKGTLQYKKH